MLNQVLRQSGGSLTDGPFAVLTQMPKLLDFDVKRIYFRKQMQKIDERVRFASHFSNINFYSLAYAFGIHFTDLKRILLSTFVIEEKT